tara:strand:- start:1802 stop:2983 length:1182 start_codon:yes stop_codon:yes gene_type:complete
MPLLNVTVKNFKQYNIEATDTTTYSQPLTTGGPAPESNSLPRSGLITLTANSADPPNDAGGEGFWSIGAHDINIGGMTGSTSGYWLTYGPEIGSGLTGALGGYWTHASNKLKDTEYDPGGGAQAAHNYFNGDYCVFVGQSGTYTCYESTYNHKIGHDFWKYHLQGTTNGEAYEPTHGLSQTYYKYWDRADLVQQYWDLDCINPDTVYQNSCDTINANLAEWSVHIKRIVAVNSMPLIGPNTSQFKAQEGNKVFVIVVLEDGVTGQDIMDLNGTLSVNINGGPQFFEYDIPSPPIDDWDTSDDTIGTSTEWYDEYQDGDTIIDTPDGDDPDDIIEGDGSVDEIVEVDLEAAEDENEGDEYGDAWGSAGLTEAAVDEEEVNNTTDYDDLVELDIR